MYLNKLFIFILILLLALFQNCFSQRASAIENYLVNNVNDSTKRIMSIIEDDFKVNIRHFEEAHLKKFINDPDFNYDNINKKAEDWISKIKNWINQQIALLRSSKTYSNILDYLYYTLAVIALIMIVSGLIKAEISGFLFGKIGDAQIKMSENEEDINHLNFENLITISIENKQYKLAIRYLFLKSLKLLSDRELIKLRNNKTNQQYLFEIKNNQIADAFRIASFRFEWIWYGDFPVDENIMKSSQTDFNKLFSMISS